MTPTDDRAYAPRLDALFAATRERFSLPEGLTYLNGNSLGPLPRGVRERVAAEVESEWGTRLIRGWNESGWIELPQQVGDRIAHLVGAAPGSIVACDSTSVNLFKVLSAGLTLRPHRRVVLSDTGNFPTDLYVAQRLLDGLGGGHELRLVEPDEVAGAIDESVAALMLTHVDYRTGRMHDMADLTVRAHAAGALAIWDLAHSAGALPVHLEATLADFAVGCSYKYLNGGPGAPAFLYVRPDHAKAVDPFLAGWMGHEAPFAFDQEYRPGPGTDRMLVGTPPVLAMAALDAALEVWEGIDLADVRARSVELTERFIAEIEARCPELELASPREAAMRGSQVSFRFEHGYAAMQALAERGVIGDFRAPDVMRFGFAPLYVGMDDAMRAAAAIETVVSKRLWDDPRFDTRLKVT